MLGDAALHTAELLAEGGGVLAELGGDVLPREAAPAEAGEGLLIIGEEGEDPGAGFFGAGIEAGGGFGGGGIDEGGGDGGGIDAEIGVCSAAFVAAVVAREIDELGADDLFEVGGERGFGVELELAGFEVFDERAGDRLADVDGLAVVAEFSAHACADEDHDEAEELVEGGIAGAGVGGELRGAWGSGRSAAAGG